MTSIEPIHPTIKTKGINPAQLRAARSLLGWTRSELAKRTGLSAETIKNAEHQIYYPKKETIKAITDVFTEHGVEMVCYESTSIIPADGDEPCHTLKFSYSNLTCMTASVHKNTEGI